MPALLFALVFTTALPSQAHTAHYDVRSACLDAQEVGVLLEQLYAKLATFFGRMPQRRLAVELYADRRSFHEALARDGQPRVDAGGYFSPETKKVYLYPQPSEYFTRQVLLHEATHQFHVSVTTGSFPPQTCWYVEGLAEFFGMHTWDGKRLRTGVVPAVTLEDYPAQALRQFDACGGDLEGIVAGRSAEKWGVAMGLDKAGAPRPLAWALVHFLMHRDPVRFASLAARLDRNEPPLAAWRQVYGRITRAMAGQFRQWIERNTQPWEIVWTGWQPWGETIEGHSSVVGMALLKRTPDRLVAELEPVDGPLKAGLAFGFRSKEDFYLLEVMSAGPGSAVPAQASIVRRIDGAWKSVISRRLASSSSLPLVALVRSGDQVTLSVDHQTITTLTAAGRVGLAVDGCKVRFRVK